MSSAYEFYLSDDAGNRITSLQGYAFFSYARLVTGYGSFQIGFPYSVLENQVTPVFSTDWRVEIWRSADIGYPMRYEAAYLLRQYNIYDREDGVRMIVLYGRDYKDLLSRRNVIQPAGYPQTLKEMHIDDMMKEIVSEQMLYNSALNADVILDNNRAYPQDEFSVQGNFSLGPFYRYTFPDKNVLDILKELQEASFELFELDEFSNRKIYFDVLPQNIERRVSYILQEINDDLILDENGEGVLEEIASNENRTIYGMQFVTFADLRGIDRTGNSLVFSVENGNISAPSYTLNRFEENNAAIIKGYGRGDSRAWDEVENYNGVHASRWNRCEIVVDASTEPDQGQLANYAYPVLRKSAVKEDIDVTFLNIPENPVSPRSLYGVDWDLGDILPTVYAGKQFALEVKNVYVSVNENGEEKITGRNSIQ